MQRVKEITLGLLVAAAYAGAVPGIAAAANMAHVHIGHVTQGWNDTPDGKGLLPTAIAESKIAAQHAGFAAKKPDDLGWVQLHTRHVLHALDISVEAKGPGRGYGMVKAARGAIKHINLAATSDGASKNVKVHAVHVSTAADNTIARAKEIIALGKRVLAAGSAGDAAPYVKQIQALVSQLLAGADANGDGKITWHQGEGGLNEAAKHMGFMVKGEGLN